MNMNKGIAAVTGGSGMVGRKISQKLLQEGYEVRILTRNRLLHIDNAQAFVGDITDERVLRLFLKNVSYLFHCAAELKDETIMWQVNVLGTERLLKIARESGIRYICHLSSVGVVGKTNFAWVNEETPCNPQNIYERTKWEAEKLVTCGIDECRVIILRPTNVIDEKQPGALAFSMNRSFLNRLIIFFKGGDCAHLIHADDVASAALHFISTSLDQPQCFIVSTDHEPMNTYGELWNLCKAIKKGDHQKNVGSVLHLPVIVPHLVRLLRRGKSNRGDIRYSSQKLISTNFIFTLGIKGAIRQVIQCGKTDER
jgi:nucleoside-diphosphate-sugar epimerase